MQARAHLLQHDLSSKDLKTKQNKKKVTYSQWISRVRIYTNQDRPSRGPDKSGTFKPCFVWIVLSEHKLHFYFLIPRVNTVNPCLEGRSRHSVWHHVIICLFYSIHISLRTHGRDVRAECIETHAEEGSTLKIQKKKKNEQTVLTSWICSNFPMLQITPLTGLGRSKSIGLWVALADKWVYSHHQTRKCPLLVGVGCFLVSLFHSYEISTKRCKSYIKGKGTEIWKKKVWPCK